MNHVQYAELEKLIKEYEEDSINLRSERLVMKNYPKVLTMSAASSFERNIKNSCQDFLDNPKHPIITTYPNIQRLLNSNRPAVDLMFAQLRTLNNSVECLDASRFYDLFGGATFESNVRSLFSTELSNKISEIEEVVNQLVGLVDLNDAYALDYVNKTDLLDQLKNASFEDAESAYLSLKLRRNRVAHDYINGLSDTFEDIKKFYNLAILYIIALENSIRDLINI